MRFLAVVGLLAAAALAAEVGCTVGTTSGVCVGTSSCGFLGGKSTAGLCPGSKDIQCCTGLRCSDSSGTCMDSAQCTGTTASNLCPGPAGFKCCRSGSGPAPPPVPAPQDPLIKMGETYSSRSSYYTFGDGTGACSLPKMSAPVYIAAINKIQYGKGEGCGMCAKVSLTDGSKSVIVKLVDKCPGCSYGNFDLSQAAFEALAPLRQGRVNNVWTPVPCPVSGGLEYAFKEANTWWIAIQVRNHALGLTKVEFRERGGQWVQANRATYNYFIRSFKGVKLPMSIRATAIDGQVIEDIDVVTEVTMARTFRGSRNFKVTGAPARLGPV